MLDTGYQCDHVIARKRKGRRSVKIFHEIKAGRAAVIDARAKGGVGLVPTMGALHEGHRSLIRASRDRCESTAVTIFVNPTQFGPGEDFDDYPRALNTDLAVCEEEGVDIVFAPSVETMYPQGGRTTVHVSELTDGLCGTSRPGHFDGVTTVVAKLCNILPADLAFFGEKDYQQLVIVRRMARDLDMAIRIVGCPIVRERDGLALSSRNQYLTADGRRRATSLSRSLFAARNRIESGVRDAASILEGVREGLRAGGVDDIGYIDVVDSETLASLHHLVDRARICVAARIESCRLIDNVGVDASKDAK